MNKPARNMLAVEDLQARERDAAVTRAEYELQRLAAEYRVEIGPEIDRMRSIFVQARKLLREERFETACMAFDEIHRSAMDIRGIAATYGFRLATLAAASLCRILEGMVDPADGSMQAIETHLDVLDEVFSDNIGGDGGPRGAVLVKQMEHLRRLSAQESAAARPGVIAARGPRSLQNQ